ncbi:DUF229 domain-containing protein [Marinilabiliaceae bacterium JC017]|nr:DUF229 domain-containing protein [Marinilabiliaceae bacterium JC017]
MKWNSGIFAASTLLLTAPNVHSQKNSVPDERPNVIIVLTDDQGSIDLNCYGAKDLATPQLDKLAGTGIRFSQFYVGAPVCSPSRAALLTGLTPQGAGLPGNASSQPGHAGMPTDRHTIADMMKEAGYVTGHVGKWHLGTTPETLPLGQGFDYSFGHHGGCIDNYSHFFYWSGPNRHDLYENGKEVWHDGEYFPDVMAQKADAFIKDHKDEPFFMYYAINMPHYPVQPSPKWRDYYAGMKDRRRADYCAFVSTIDERIGWLMNTLEETGLRDNTIVIFLADHGHSSEVRNFFGGGNAGSYRGSKFSLFEGGVRVPAIISWPGHVAQNEVRDQWVMSIDLMPTIAEMCGIKQPEEIVGRSMVSALKDAKSPAIRNQHVWQLGTQWSARKDNWKLVGNPVDHTEKGDSLDMEKDRLFLCNLDEDISEMHNYASEYPDKVKELTGLYLDWEFAEPSLVPGMKKSIDHKGRQAHYTLLTKPAGRYDGMSNTAFSDGETGTTSFSDGYWVGFNGNDMELIIDLGKKQKLSKVSVGCLQDQQSWVFLPEKMEVAISGNGNNYQVVDGYEFIQKTTNKNEIVRPELTFEKTKARFVKVIVKNIGQLPKGHNGEGEKAWMFIDEVVVD